MQPYPSLLHLVQLVHIEVAEELLKNSQLVNNHVAGKLNTCHVKVLRLKWIMIMVILPYFSPSPASKNLTMRLFIRKHRLKVTIYRVSNDPNDQYQKISHYKGSHPLRKVQFFLTLFKRPLTPPPFV